MPAKLPVVMPLLFIENGTSLGRMSWKWRRVGNLFGRIYLKTVSGVNEVIYRISKFYRLMGESRELVLNNSLKNFANEQKSRKYLMNSIHVFPSYFLHYFEVHVCLSKHFQIIYRRYSLIVARVLIFGSSKKILPDKWSSLSPVFHLLHHFIIHIHVWYQINNTVLCSFGTICDLDA